MLDARLHDADWLTKTIDVIYHLALPAFTLAIIYLAIYARLARASMLDVLGADYVRTARAKGASERSVLFKHALRNAALPIITVAGLQFGGLISGALLVETVFNWPGMGTLAFDAILRRDYTDDPGRAVLRLAHGGDREPHHGSQLPAGIDPRIRTAGG